MSPEETKLPIPASNQILETVLSLGMDVHLELDEAAVVAMFQEAITHLFPGRRACVRIVDLRSRAAVRVYAEGQGARSNLAKERIRIRPSAVAKTKLKTAEQESARLLVDERWESPFERVAQGFSVPLVAAGVLYGVLDVGYELGSQAPPEDEELLLPVANYLSVALRNKRLHRETTLLRDYQSRLIEHANALILGVGGDLRISVCNLALCRLTGFTRDELIGRDVRDWFSGEQAAKLTKLFIQALEGQEPDSVDVELPTKSGTSVRTVWSVGAVGSRGRIEGIVGIGQDQSRLADLQNQVIHAEKLATLGQLAAGVVHELNNPLTSITVYAEFLEKKLGQAQVRVEDADLAKLRQIGRSARRIMDFARDLVQYAKPAGYDLEPVSLNHVVHQALPFCEHLFQGGTISLEQALEDELPRVLAVPGQLEQVVINLVTNAVHALEGGGRVEVRTHRAGDRVALVVSDSGSGISKEHLERVFEPFFTTKSDGQGTGLGLSIVRNIAEQHNGTVLVGEGPLGGAQFTVSFPTEPQG